MPLPGKAMQVAIRLWFEAGLAKSDRVKISMTGMAKKGISRFAASRGLVALEKARLVSVVRHAGRKPEVTILAAPLTKTPSPDAVEPARSNEVVTRPDEKGSGEGRALPPSQGTLSGE